MSTVRDYVEDVRRIDAIEATADNASTSANPVFTGTITEQVATNETTVIEGATGTIINKVMTGDLTLTDGLSNGQSVTVFLTTAGFTPTLPTVTWIGEELASYATTDVIVFIKNGATLYAVHSGAIA